MLLIACEFSGTVRDAFIRQGVDAISCDLQPNNTGPHIQRDVRELLRQHWDGILAFPPCTYLCASGMHWTTRGLRDPQLTEDALRLVNDLLAADSPRIALENPIGVISSRIRRPDQYIQPYQFGDDASKATCLWLKGLPTLRPTTYVEPRMVNGKPRWSNQTDSGQNRLSPSPDRWARRSMTYPGIADAMAVQWAPLFR